MNKRTILNIALALCISFSILSVTAFLLNFHTLPISKKTSDWSNFGAYISGTIGPLMSLISILFVLRSLDITNHNHNSIMEFNKTDKIQGQIKDLSDTIKTSLEEHFLFKKEHPTILPYSSTICSRIMNTLPIRGDMSIEEVAIKAVKEEFYTFSAEIKLTVKLVNLLNQLDQIDRDVFKALVEVKITAEMRAVLFCFACKQLPGDAAIIKAQWPSFLGGYFAESAPSLPPQDTNSQ